MSIIERCSMMEFLTLKVKILVVCHMLVLVHFVLLFCDVPYESKFFSAREETLRN